MDRLVLTPAELRSSASSSTINFCCDCAICAPPLSVRYDRPVIDARAPPAHPAAGRKQRRRMSSVTLPQASAGAALFGRAVLGPLDNASRLVPPRGTFSGRLRVPYVDNATMGNLFRGGYFFAWQGQQWCQERPPRIFLIFQKVTGEASFGNSW